MVKAILPEEVAMVKSILPGGRAEGKPLKDFDPKQLSMGIKIELEHTDDEDLAREIAMDHLAEIPDYYTRLKRMESDAGVKEAMRKMDAALSLLRRSH
jgi:hypothetical protein